MFDILRKNIYHFERIHPSLIFSLFAWNNKNININKILGLKFEAIMRHIVG